MSVARRSKIRPHAQAKSLRMPSLFSIIVRQKDICQHSERNL
ncbi:hypothetical protein HMPREF0971_03034 [Segatella oris F0302]|uniref:Uncharacterized protein n=1 Tax=Segatella oris F0302 TaxID=649760 RepID=D1QVA9_9BACT|nr:hypothetical protein HMPREF0971_03034 [Segatella oris F0302]